MWRTRTVRRKTLGERWTKENLEMVGGVPWQMEEERVEVREAENKKGC